MKLIKEDGELLYVHCNLCKKEFTIEKLKCNKTSEGYEVNEVIKCSTCGERDSSIVDYKRMLKRYNTVEKRKNIESFEREKKIHDDEMRDKNVVKCPRCSST